VKRGEADEGALADAHVVGIGRGQLRLDRQRRAIGDDVHQLLSGRDDAAAREHGQADDRAGGRRPDVDPRQLVAGCGPLRARFGEGILDVAKLARDSLVISILRFEDLQPGFALLTAAVRRSFNEH
jgi:hypothetical protein